MSIRIKTKSTYKNLAIWLPESVFLCLVSPQTNSEEMVSNKVSIDLSEFVQYGKHGETVLEGIRDHMRQLASCTEIEEVKLLGPTGFYLPGDEIQDNDPFFEKTVLKRNVDAVKALFPELGQQRTIERVEFRFFQFVVADEMGSLQYCQTNVDENPPEIERPGGSLVVNSLYFYMHFHPNEIICLFIVHNILRQLRMFQNLGVNVRHTVLVCMYHPKFNPPKFLDVDELPEGVEVKIKPHEQQLFEGNYHVPYVTTSKQSKYAKTELSKQLKLNQIHNEKSKGGGVAVAVLSSGYDYNSSSKWNVVDRHNFNSQYSPVHECFGGVGSILTNILSQIAPEAKLIACRTSFDHLRHLFPSSATSRALNWLRGKWKAREWGEDVHSLVVLIPYGGHYREDEMRAINGAIDDGIIVVCAAGSTISQSHGDHVPGIAFPASMGNVLCVGAMDYQNEPAFDSPSGREIDCVAVSRHDSRYCHYVVVGTGISAAILSGMVALILSYIKSSLSAIPGGCPEYNHVSIIREVLQQTTTSTKHHPHSGYGLPTNRIFSFSQRQLEKLLNSITHERNVRTIPGSASDMTEECKFNSQILSNSELNSELEPISLDGGGIRVAVIDDDFPKILKTNYKAGKLQKEMDSWDKCTPAMSEDAKLLKQTAESLKKLASDLEGMIPSMIKLRTLEKEIATVEEKIDHIKNEIHSTYTPIKDSHGLQCALVVANTAPKAHLLLINTRQHPTSEDLAVEVEKLVEQRKRPDVIVCSLGFDQFNLRLSQAINKAINAGIIPVFSAGNIGLTSSNTISYPSRLGNVLCIGANTCDGTHYSSSSVGREIDFLAPGKFMILDKYPVSGTSFSAPAAAAFIALILQYVDQVVSGELEHVPIEEKYKSINAWSEEPPGSNNWGWHNVPLNKACRNVYVMRELLRQMSVHRTEHSDSAGYGNLDIRRLLKDLEPEDIHSIIQNFHKHST